MIRAPAVGLIAGILLATFGATAQQPAAPSPQRPMVLEGGTLIDGTGRAPIPDAVIVVQGTRITAMGTKGKVAIPANAQIINLAGRTILPGLIDGHIHTQEWHYPMFLHYGVTTVVDLDSDTGWIFNQRDMLNSGRIKGPRMFVAGGKLYGPLDDGAGPPEVVHDDGPTINRNVDEVMEHMHATEALGADYIKIDDTLTYEQLAAVIAEGKRTGLKVIGHTQNLRKAVEMGVRYDEHMNTMARSLLDPDGTKFAAVNGRLRYPTAPEAQIDPKDFPPLVAELVKLGVYVNPTLVAQWIASTPRARQFADDAARITKDPGLAFVPDEQKKLWLQPPEKPHPGYANVAKFLKEFSAAGGKIVVGTDASRLQTTIPGLSEHYEMQILADIGIPPMKIIEGATLWNAEALGKDKEIGSVEVGKLADFTIIDGNPLAYISATRNIRMVIKGGKVMDTAYDPHWANPIPRPNYAATPLWLRVLSPLMASEGGPAVTVTLEGTGFHPDATAHLDNATLPTHFVSSTKLTATIGPQLLQKVGEQSLYVVNPGPRGGISLGKAFLVKFKN